MVLAVHLIISVIIFMEVYLKSFLNFGTRWEY